MKTIQSAYRLAPWRKQVQNILNVIIVLVFIASVTMIYLYSSAQMTKMKLEIQKLHEERSNLTRMIADYLTREGQITSFDEMEKRAQQAGYIPIDMNDEETYTYLPIAGFREDNYSGLDNVPRNLSIPVSIVKPEYTESLQRWLNEHVSIKKRGE
jgi:ribosomal protein S8